MHNAGRFQRLISSTDPVIFKMPRSPLKVNSWRALTLLLAFTAFVSFVLIEAGAQGRRLQSSQSNSSGAGQQQTRRKNIASVRSLDTSDGSRVTITSDVPLNDYEAYWGGDRFFVIIPNAEITYQNVQTLQASLRGRGFQDARIERKGNDLVFSFRMQYGFRARPEQKFNRLDIILTAPPGLAVNPNVNRNTRPVTQGGGGTTVGTELGGNTNRSTTTTGGGGGSTASSGGSGGGTRTSAGSGVSAGTRTGGRTRGSRSGVYSGYRGGGGDRGGGTPLNIPLPSDIQAPTPTPTATSPSNSNAAANTSASPSASPGTGVANTAQANASPATSLSPTPEQIARNEPQSPVTAPPATTTTNPGASAPAATTGFAAAIREYWLPLLIGLLVLGAIVLLMASRSRAGAAEGRERETIQTRKQETIKDKPASRTGAAAAGMAGAAAVAAMAKESRAKAAPTKETPRAEETKAVEPATPAVGMERVSTEVKGLLEGKDYDEAVVSSTNPDTRQIVSTELLAALASRNPERRLRAREAFIKHGFFDEATKRLRTSEAAAERISAARALGLTQDNSATQHLVAALEDDDPEVRRASVNALAELRDPSAIGPLNALLEREKNRKVPHSLIRRAIEASATIDLPETAAQTTTPPAAAARAQDSTATGADKKDKDDEDREVFEI